ncbi:hypothetical protein MFIFM68171_06615 [Madurella fahalii]|uniref:FabD/lysophospholipase-like protein n=1 Tax=Madurella fahalii TaxID=1157608 RepID=A0ABQ0GFC8_9PEZI
MTDSHWDRHLPHQENGTLNLAEHQKIDGEHQENGTLNLAEHQKIDGELNARLMQALEPPNAKELEHVHRINETAAWFGVERFGGTRTPPVLRDYGRLADLMSHHAPKVPESAPNIRDNRTPSLVSFVGGTGAGKSTLIRILIVLCQALCTHDQAPVMGRAEDTISPSEDVHLYQDPKTAKDKSPILFADCEGLGGSEPQAAKARESRWRDWNRLLESQKDGDTTGARPSAPELRRVVLERPIEWEKKDGRDTWSREDFVRDLYPRLLYTFSDVVVYVLGASNHRKIGDALHHLISWVHVAIRTSSNQPVLPSAIVVLNSSDHAISSDLWDVSANTEKVFQDLGSIKYDDPTDRFINSAKSWPASGDKTRIKTVKELALHYYSSVQVIRLPAKEQSVRMSMQAIRLRSCISDASARAHDTRMQSRILLDVEQLQAYFQDALSHYATTLDEPFDFVQASFRHSPISADFGENVLRLALNVIDPTRGTHQRLSRKLERGFYEVRYVMASSILLNSTRRKNMGVCWDPIPMEARPLTIVPARDAAALFSQYREHLKQAVQTYRDKYWPCEFQLSGRRCVNLASGHCKGHQSHDGWPLGSGDYLCSVDWTALEENFVDCVGKLLTQLVVLPTSETQWRTRTGPNASQQEHLSNDQKAAARIHRERILPNFLKRVPEPKPKQDGDGCPLSDQKSCLYCLAGMAEHPLPCGHILCKACVEASGEWAPVSRVEVEITQCPVGCHIQGDGQNPWLIYLKPASTGARILSLDGGGIRGIAELEVLLQIEEALGGKIPIQSFFDLIVGTSAGGLIALGLTSMNWTVQQCTQKFEEFCDVAFTKRRFAGRHGVLSIVDIFLSCKYHTKPLENALKDAFTEERYLFGDAKRANSRDFPTRVAVTTTTDGSAHRTHVLSNYNPPGIGKCPAAINYHFQRPDRRRDEIRIWEAARATSAAPGYFKPFQRKGSPTAYLDGAFFHNNPVEIANQERKLLWPDYTEPDILLSLGTGKEPGKDLDNAAPSRRTSSNLKYKFDLLRANIDANLDCDLAWKKFEGSQISKPGDHLGRSKYVRLNPEVSEKLPELDEKKKLREIGQVARKLIAASFYFETKTRISAGSNGDSDINGHILCQMPHREDVSEIGAELKRLVVERQIPLSFVVSSIHDSGAEAETYSQPFTEQEMERMVQYQSSEPFQKPLSFKVSGFPRRPKELRQMTPTRAAISGLIAPTSETNDISLPPKDDSAVDWTSPDLERYPDPKITAVRPISRSVSM